MRWTLVLISCALARAASAQPPKVDPRADEQLRKMSRSLADIGSMQFDAEHTLEVVNRDGEKLQFVASSRLSVQRPNKLRTERLGAVADTELYYDGKTITLFGKRANVYASTPAPDTLDQAIDFARDKLGLEAPAADLLYADAYSGLMEHVVSGRYVGLESIGDHMCHHLAFRERDVDWQIWIEDTAMALPCRYVITSTRANGGPELSVSFHNWNMSPKLEGLDFVFRPPHDATESEFPRVPMPDAAWRAAKLGRGHRHASQRPASSHSDQAHTSTVAPAL